MPGYNPNQILDDICSAAGCNRQQVITVVGRAFEALHKVAFCDEQSVPMAMGECLDQFGSKACYHLVGLLDEARVFKGNQIDVPLVGDLHALCPGESGA